MKDNTHKEFDQIFREKLHQHEVAPPEHIWAGVQAEALNTTAGKSSQWRWWAAASLLGILLATASYFYAGVEELDTIIESTQTIESAPNTTETIVEHTSTTSLESQNSITEEDMISDIVDKTPIEEQIDDHRKSVIEEAMIEQKTNLAFEEVEKIEEVEELLEVLEVERDIQNELNASQPQEEIAQTKIKKETIEAINGIVAESLNTEEEIATDINKNLENLSATEAGRDFFDEDALNDMTRGHRNEKYWELGLEFSPEWVTIPENDNNIQSYGLDLSAKYHFGKLFLETGLGASLSKDDGIYHVDYENYEFKGSYYDVYDVTFDTSGSAPIPTYYTKLVNVYDTIDKATITENKNTYVYINIPINFGYYTSLGKKFSFYAKTGLNASILIYQDIPEPTITGELYTIIKTTPLYHQRTEWNLQAQINVGINYHITENFRFGVEPNARYYVKSLVENNDGGNPYGFGVKVGFKYVLK